MNVVFVGGGSFRTLPIVRGVLQNPKVLDGGEIRLVDFNLPRVETVARLMKLAETARRELPKTQVNFQHAAHLARTFCQDGEQELLAALVQQSIKRGKGPASPLGRLRRRLQQRKEEFMARRGE